ncbi:unnamed protein product [Ceutorhynchus assimilis]|uniref:Uncharacterized protein n=1 Tax=Ceutorhynchus assimilis TaxID=467358 RepID=A0A9P0DM32_9CUCU|nr:unnamed protein product [Ceutorhynchus assimilis]
MLRINSIKMAHQDRQKVCYCETKQESQPSECFCTKVNSDVSEKELKSNEGATYSSNSEENLKKEKSVLENVPEHVKLFAFPEISPKKVEFNDPNKMHAPNLPTFQRRARMFKPKTAEPSQFIMDVPDAWGMAPDGSMMDAFNKLEIKE